jgi:hypothetical protein
MPLPQRYRTDRRLALCPSRQPGHWMRLGKAYSLLCHDKGISIADLGLAWPIRVKEGMTRLALLLPPGSCAIAANPLAQ